MLMMLMLLLLTDLGFVGSAQQVGESGGEDSEDEWNYIKVEKKSEGLAAVKEEVSEILESPLVEERQEILQFEEDKENVSSRILRSQQSIKTIYFSILKSSKVKINQKTSNSSLSSRCWVKSSRTLSRKKKSWTSATHKTKLRKTSNWPSRRAKSLMKCRYN